MNELKRNVQNVDYDAFEAMCDRNRFNDTAIKSDWDYFHSRFTGAEVHNVDCTATAFSNTEIVFDFILYWGVSDSAQTNASSKISQIANMYLVYDQRWYN